MANTRPRGLRRPKVIKDTAAAQSELARVFLEHPHWVKKIPLIVRDLKLDTELRVEPQTIDRALTKLANLAAIDRDYEALFSFIRRLIQRAYPGTKLVAVPEDAEASRSRLEPAVLKAMAAEVRRIQAEDPNDSPSLRDIVADRSFKRRFPVIGGPSKQSGRVTEGTARKAIARQLKVGGAGE